MTVDAQSQSDVQCKCDDDQSFWFAIRQMFLMGVDAIERYKLRIAPRTAELRKQSKPD